jgi:hypothetical protein
MTISGPLFIILLIHWELVKWICSVILGSFGHWQGGLWLRSLKQLAGFCPYSWVIMFAGKIVARKSETTHLFLPQVLATNPTHHGPDDRLMTTLHHSFDPLGAGEMDLQVILGSFGHL